MKCLPQNFKIVEAISPAADADGRTGDYVSLKNVLRAWVIAHVTQGNAATVELSLSKATAVAGTGATAVAAEVPIWANQDCAAGDSLTRQDDAASFTTSATLKHKMVVFQVDPAVLGDYDCIALVTGDSNAANITQATYILEERYQQATPPAAITD